MTFASFKMQSRYTILQQCHRTADASGARRLEQVASRRVINIVAVIIIVAIVGCKRYRDVCLQIILLSLLFFTYYFHIVVIAVVVGGGYVYSLRTTELCELLLLFLLLTF